jgi:hypothetical protein
MLDKKDNISIKDTLKKHGILMEDMNSKMDLILENKINRFIQNCLELGKGIILNVNIMKNKKGSES